MTPFTTHCHFLSQFGQCLIPLQILSGMVSTVDIVMLENQAEIDWVVRPKTLDGNGGKINRDDRGVSRFRDRVRQTKEREQGQEEHHVKHDDW